jgi:hypothetical protein
MPFADYNHFSQVLQITNDIIILSYSYFIGVAGMDSVMEYTTQIIDLCDVLLQHQDRLTREQAEHIAMIYQRTVGFVTDFLQQQPGTIQSIAGYLNHDAFGPLTIMLGYSDLMLMGAFGEMDEVVREVVQYIRDYSGVLHEELKELQTLMVNLRQRLNIPSEAMA